MRIALACLALASVLVSPAPAVAGARSVDGTAAGKHHNNVWNRWSTVPISAYVDDAGNAYIRGGDGGILKARGFLTPSDTESVIALLKKSQQWVKTAKQEGLEITKELGSFMSDSGFSENGVALHFFAADKGRQADVILSLVDFENQFYKLELYLDPTQVRALIGLLERVPETVAELRRQSAAAASLR